MSNTVISVENLTKSYDLGVIGTGTLSRDLNRWWAFLRGQPDPYTKIGQEDKLKRRGESILALDDVSFTVQQGEALGIIGANGAGKSTLLKILSRVTAPTSGVVKVKGRIGSLLEVGTGFHPELTGRENVFLNGAILGMRKEEVGKKFDEIVDFSGVEKFIDTPVKRYSSGMYVRLAFAVAAHLDPEILVVDEVLAVGDAEFQKKCLGKMGDVAGEGRTVLFVSHNMEAVTTLCNRTILVDNGCVLLDNRSEIVISRYLNEHFQTDYKKLKYQTGQAAISKLWFSDDKGNVKDSYIIGEPVIVNIELDNPNSESLEVELAFFDKAGVKLWNFTHKAHELPPITTSPTALVKIFFHIPKLNLNEILVHVGLRKSNDPIIHYVDHIYEGLHFFIKHTSNKNFKKDNSLIFCPIDYYEDGNEV